MVPAKVSSLSVLSFLALFIILVTFAVSENNFGTSPLATPINRPSSPPPAVPHVALEAHTATATSQTANPSHNTLSLTAELEPQDRKSFNTTRQTQKSDNRPNRQLLGNPSVTTEATTESNDLTAELEDGNAEGVNITNVTDGQVVPQNTTANWTQLPSEPTTVPMTEEVITHVSPAGVYETTTTFPKPSTETTTLISNDTTTTVPKPMPQRECYCSFQVGAFIGGIILGAVIGVIGVYLVNYLTTKSTTFAHS